STQREIVASQLGLGHFCERQTAIGTTVQCWGSNAFGQSAATTACTGLAGQPVAPPTDRAWLDIVRDRPPAIAVAGSRSCALASNSGMDATGFMYCWGDNRDGLLGEEITDPLPATPALATGILAWSTLAVGPAHTCAIDEDGGVWCWGRNEFGEVGS